MIIPTVVDENRMFDIYSRLLKDRVILLTGPVDEKSSELIVAAMLFLQAEDPKKPISLYINSPGGSVIDGLAIVDTMNLISCPVYTYCIGQCASMGAVLLAAGEKDHRFALPNSRIMLHMVSSGTSGQILDMNIHVQESNRLNDKLFTLLSQYTKQSVKKLKNICNRDNFMDPEQALELGLIDKILTKK